MPETSGINSILAYQEGGDFRWNAGASRGTPVVVTYSFTTGDDLDRFQDSATDGSSFFAFTAAQQDSFRQATEVYSDVAGIIFVEVDGEAMINVARGEGTGRGGYAHYPSPEVDYAFNHFGVLVLDNTTDLSPGQDGFRLLLHELGHASGLSHPHEGPYTLSDRLDDIEHTVMTYNNSYRHDSDTVDLGSLDVAALQHLYGNASATRGWVARDDGDMFYIRGSSRAETITAVDQATKIKGGLGADTLHGRAFDDILVGGGGHDKLKGNGGDDLLKGGGKNDRMWGGIGDDKLFGGRGDDRLKGQDGNDILVGNKGNDRLFGGDGDDNLSGGSGNDRLEGGYGQNVLTGGRGDDKLISGGWSDEMTGGSGADRFIFDTRNTFGTTVDITDFSQGTDSFAIRSTEDLRLETWDTDDGASVSVYGETTGTYHGTVTFMGLSVDSIDVSQFDFI
mgnify:CR=1 FL=1